MMNHYAEIQNYGYPMYPTMDEGVVASPYDMRRQPFGWYGRRPFFFGPRPGFPFLGGFLGGLAAGALLRPPFGYPYPYYPYSPYGYYW